MTAFWPISRAAHSLLYDKWESCIDKKNYKYATSDAMNTCVTACSILSLTAYLLTAQKHVINVYWLLWLNIFPRGCLCVICQCVCLPVCLSQPELHYHTSAMCVCLSVCLSQPELHYHTSAVLSAAVDSMSLPYRKFHTPSLLTDLTNALSSHGRKVAGGSLHVVHLFDSCIRHNIMQLTLLYLT